MQRRGVAFQSDRSRVVASLLARHTGTSTESDGALIGGKRQTGSDDTGWCSSRQSVPVMMTEVRDVGT